MLLYERRPPPGFIQLPQQSTTDPLDSPSIYYTAPSSPYVESPATPSSPPPLPPLHIPTTTTTPTTAAHDMPIDPLILDDGTLGPLERIYLYSRSKAAFHRVFIIHVLPSFLEQITPLEADEYVLPLLRTLAMDEDETVKEALAAELVPIIWWFFTHCQLVSEDIKALEYHQPTPAPVTTICVTAFTPILGTLLLSPNSSVGSPARQAVVDILLRIYRADEKEGLVPPIPLEPQYGLPQDDDDDELLSGDDLVIGLFSRTQRQMFASELICQVVIGMGRLDVKEEEEPADIDARAYDYESWSAATPSANDHPSIACESHAPGSGTYVEEVDEERKNNFNPYFPSFPAPSPIDSSPSDSTPSSTASTSSSSPSSTVESIDMHDGVSNGSSSTVSPPEMATDDSPPSSSSKERQPEDQSQHYLPNPVSGPPSPLIAHSSPVMPMSRPLLPSSPARSLEETSWPAESSVTQHSTDPALLRPDLERRNSSPPHDGSFSIPSTFRESNDVHRFSETEGMDVDEYDDELDSEAEQAAVGRVSSMSLMAAVAASGSLSGSFGEETKHAFVKEVQRVGLDPVHWVRREASFALGALAKVIPQEVVLISLLPLYENLQHDHVWHVRHSALFALPAVLSRLSPKRRRELALDTVMPLARDPSPAVRSGVLEALGEVIHTFHEDPAGPPDELLHLFLGRREDKRVRDGSQHQELEEAWGLVSPMQILQPDVARTPDDPLEAFYTDPARPLTCAFNYPAVAMTLGKDRWGDLREAYLELAENRAGKVRRTLAASIGALARIIGAEHAERDLLAVWWDALKCPDEDVRGRAVECAREFMQELGEATRVQVLQGLLDGWNAGSFRDWRERETIAKMLGGIAVLVKESDAKSLRSLLMKGLEDNVAAIREAAVSSLPVIYRVYSTAESVRRDLHDDVVSLSRASNYRKRMTFIACKQALITPSKEGQAAVVADDEFWSSLAHLADDTIVGVRIGLARLVGYYYGEFCRGSHHAPSSALASLARRLADDVSHEVQAFVPDPGLLELPRGDADMEPASHGATSASVNAAGRRQLGRIFSQPPSLPRDESAASAASSLMATPVTAPESAIIPLSSVEDEPMPWLPPPSQASAAEVQEPGMPKLAAPGVADAGSQYDDLSTALFARLEQLGGTLLEAGSAVSVDVGVGLHSPEMDIAMQQAEVEEQKGDSLGRMFDEGHLGVPDGDLGLHIYFVFGLDSAGSAQGLARRRTWGG
ncbi:hypothetical protein HGRIS_013168 [Hohenbuehelia grisea]|uniref:ARM repeat-containing protein n=1 Tax=Hohenbuehelia grisea TaxID=104357 RepID=A0ABR3IUX1_9AGAR